MELEDKKILAEWMGITIYNMEILPENPDYPLVWFFKETQWNKSPFYFKIEDEDGEEWGPDYNHNQFKELENHLLDGDSDFLNKYIQLIGGIILIDPVISKETAMFYGLTISIETKCRAILKIAKEIKNFNNGTKSGN